MARSERIGPTALYTGTVWVRNGLSHPAFATGGGQFLFQAVRPAMVISRALGGPTLDGILLARHRIIDHVLTEAIDAGRVTQVIEVACGMSPRGWRFARKYGDDLTYVEADLPGMVARKRAALVAAGDIGANHTVVEIDARKPLGDGSLAALADDLDNSQGLAIITEGLINYLDTAAVVGLWERTAAILSQFRSALYLSDVILRDDSRRLFPRIGAVAISLLVRGRIHLHFEDDAAAHDAVSAAGFGTVRMHRGDAFPHVTKVVDEEGARLTHVIEAS